MAAEGSQFVLKATEDPTEVGWTNHASYTAFGKKLSLDQYVRREQALYNHPFSRDGYTYLLQRPPNDPYLCSCENFKRPLYFTDELPDGSVVVREGLIGSIATVFTPEKNRKKGYASELMQRVIDDCRGRLGLTCSSLYSDIGPRFYETFGWRTYPSRELLLDISTVEAKATVQPSKYVTRLLTLEESLNLIPLDNHLLKSKDLPAAHARLRASTPSPTKVRAAAVGVTKNAHDWFAVRGNFYAREVRHMSDEQVGQMAYGISVGTVPTTLDSPQTSPYAFGLLFLDVKFPEAFITRLRIEPGPEGDASDPAERAATAAALSLDVLRAVANECRRLGISKLHIWDPEAQPGLVEGAALLKKEDASIDVKVDDRHDELSCFSWFGQDGADLKDWEDGNMVVQWVANEKYTWC
ncbi:hypothetical protein M427DRAFT_27779 [Gonapodya prolifera JEL478]|uniref:LYC1 C-terminal domain-containing protein n=1 Tax=Gonapodya prolifera (strain JEL478) TaxID=1344416 RepID=A0A139AXF8_GONPJ|nr:hypothetical protein M427DRAFT_27779 [Gonapodya prolifera JEL478]|eukprot:KXS21400.1 hypothetical protein M427DRAFT_27779 [Gonapodya prolifera JEL478]